MTGSRRLRYSPLMRLAFMGTPDFAVPTLDALLEAGHEVVAVYTQPPRPGGRRGRELTPSPVHKRAEAAGIEVRTPERLRGEEEQAAFAALDLDVAVVAAYGLILPEPILSAPRHGCLNVHGSLLPRWRGAAPVQRAILAGDEKTGVCIMQMEKGLDTGPVFACRETAIGEKSAGELTGELAGMGAALMVEVLERFDVMTAVPQLGEGVTYAHKIDKSEARIDFSQSVAAVVRQVQALSPTPGAYFEVQGDRVKVLQAVIMPPVCGGTDEPPRSIVAGETWDANLSIGCGDGLLRPTLVQRAGKGAMSVDELLRGFPISAGTPLE